MSLEDTLQIDSLKSSSFHAVYLAFLSTVSKFLNPVREAWRGAGTWSQRNAGQQGWQALVPTAFRRSVSSLVWVLYCPLRVIAHTAQDLENSLCSLKGSSVEIRLGVFKGNWS